MDAEREPVALHYDTVRDFPWHKRKRVRQIAVVVVIAAIGWCLWQWLPPFVNRVSFLRLQNQAAAYQMTSSGPLLDTSISPTTKPFASLDQRYWTAWRATHYLYPTSINSTLLFMHKMVTPRGDERIVAIYGALKPPTATVNGEISLVAWAYAMRGGKWAFRPSTDTRRNTWGLLGSTGMQIILHSGDAFAISAGRLDPTDPSRLTFAYTLNGTTGVIRAQLIDAQPTFPEPAAGVDFDQSGVLFRTRSWSGEGVSLRKP